MIIDRFTHERLRVYGSIGQELTSTILFDEVADRIPPDWRLEESQKTVHYPVVAHSIARIAAVYCMCGRSRTVYRMKAGLARLVCIIWKIR